VGQRVGDAFPSRALVEHWNGHEWRVAPAESSSSHSSDPYAATVIDGRLLAAGDQENDLTPQTTLSFTSAASSSAIVPSANVGSGENDFYAVASRGDVALAAGRVTDRATDLQSPLVETLKDGSWSLLPTPNPAGPGGSAGFGGVTIAPSGQAWAVGVYATSSSANRTLIERFVP
jgi:hypothetical protein